MLSTFGWVVERGGLRKDLSASQCEKTFIQITRVNPTPFEWIFYETEALPIG